MGNKDEGKVLRLFEQEAKLRCKETKGRDKEE